ncbi:hypothetical protein LCGC14_0382240 [marine sediment metagenome]|uniref:Uncharacterized protein n=1 Tax=marine sediment metagenome TaxID=412755 RepID=A0A0F9T1N9_9ZZZZ
MYPMDGTIETLKASNERLRAVNAKLLEALERSADKLHSLRDEPECLGHVFRDCPKSYCVEARDAIKEATE